MRLRPSSFVLMGSGLWTVAFLVSAIGGVALMVIRPAWWPLSAIYVGCGLVGVYAQRRARRRMTQHPQDEHARLKVVRTKLRADLERRGVKVRPMLIDEDVR